MISLLLDYYAYLENYWLFLVLMLICIAFSSYAQHKVNSTYRDYSTMPTQNGETADSVARRILDSADLQDIQLKQVNGHLTDYYHHKKKEIGLSASVYGNTTVAAIAVATHEVGHAIQYKQKSIFAIAKRVLVPICNIGTYLMWPLIVIGLILIFGEISTTGDIFLYVGIGIFGLSTLISLITVPLERDASRRAIKILQSSNAMTEEELIGAKKVLDAASLTYVASLLVSILQLLRIIIILMPKKRR